MKEATAPPAKKPATIHVVLAAACLWGIHALWPWASHGDDLASAILLLLAFVGGRQVLGALDGFDRWRERGRITRLAHTASDTHGTARWATNKDVKRAGMTKEGGIFLGTTLDGTPLYYNGETHLLTVAPPGAGKGVCQVVPNLLTYRGSTVVADPKGELYSVTARYRREKLGHRIVVLAPWCERMSRELDVRIPDDGWNVCSFLKPGPEVKDEAEMVGSLLMPKSAGANATEEFFTDFGEGILTAFLLDRVSRCGASGFDLTDVRADLHQRPSELHEALYDMSHNEDFGGAIAQYASKLLGNLKNAPETFEGGLASAQRTLRIYDANGPLGQHVAKDSGFDFASMKETPTTVYLIIPSDRIGTHGAWLNTVLSLAMETVGRDRSNRRVLFMLDEAANLGHMPNILRAMALYRGQGVQVWTVVQQISQLARLYGQEGMREFIGLAEVVNTFGIWEPDTLRLVSDWLGQRTIKDFSQNVTPVLADGDNPFGYHFGAANHASALMRTEDIRTMPSDQQLIFHRNEPPIQARKVSYLDRRQLRRRADPNPYHRFNR